MNGFPPGTLAGRPASISLHGMLHITAAGIAFLCLIAACFVLARRFDLLGQRQWAAFSRAAGVLFVVGFGGVASGSTRMKRVNVRRARERIVDAVDWPIKSMWSDTATKSKPTRVAEAVPAGI